MGKDYQLVNPYIEGSMQTTFKDTSSHKAAKQAWNNISEHVTNNVPQFGFTLRDSTGKFHHFGITESLKGGSKVNFKINKISLTMTKEQSDGFKNNIKKAESQHGGRSKSKRDDSSDDKSDSSSSSSSNEYNDIYDKVKLFRKKNQKTPITYWWYTPSIYGINDIYIPTFASYLQPYVHILPYLGQPTIKWTEYKN